MHGKLIFKSVRCYKFFLQEDDLQSGNEVTNVIVKKAEFQEEHPNGKLIL